MITSAQNFNYYRDDTKWVCNLLNLWGIENNVVIGRDGSYSAIYKLTGIDYYLQTDNSLNRLAHINDLFLTLLPDDFIITFIYKISTFFMSRLRKSSSFFSLMNSNLAGGFADAR